ncbi:hypothetical protein BJV74DRAFT_795445 [Russula compacta]|nr:hypothetical protein BJV74DRAFT_795445 [Russula compacta]
MAPDRPALFSKLSSIITNISFSNTSTRPTFMVSKMGNVVAYRTKQLLIKVGRAITQLNGTGPRLQQVAIEILPDDVLLDIFSFYVDEADKEDEWHSLVHVCQRWRNLVFASPRRLHLTLVYNPNKPVGEMLDIWPALPFGIILDLHGLSRKWRVPGLDNTIAALEHHERIRRITVSRVSSWVLGRLAEGMCQPFPMLTSLQLSRDTQSETRLPDSFLSGSAPRLRTLALIGISFPALPNLLLSATDLVHLDLWDIPNSAYFSPNEMVVCLSTLTRLSTLYLGFRSSLPGGTGRRLPPLTRSVLHALTTLRFSGNSEYMEDFISHIDAPLLNDIDITFAILSDTPELLQFISRAEMSNSFNRAAVRFYRDCVDITLSSENLRVDQQSARRLRVSSVKSDWQLMSLVQLCGSTLPLPLLSILESLDIYTHVYLWRYTADHTHWLELLGLFPSVKSLSLSDRLILPVMTALGELVGGRALEVLPVLQNLSTMWSQEDG